MKKILSLVVLTSFLFFGCNKASNPNPGSEMKNYSTKRATGYESYLAEINNVGILHNKCMDYLLDEMINLKSKGSKPASEEAMNDMIKDDVVVFYKQNGIDVSSCRNSYIYQGEDISLNSFSSTAQNILNQMYESVHLLTAGDIDDSKFVTICADLKRAAYNLSVENESNQVGYAVSIAEHSSLYWRNEGKKFDDVIENAGEMTKNQEAVIKADIGGAIVGGFGGIIDGMFGATCASFIRAISVKGGFNWLWI